MKRPLLILLFLFGLGLFSCSKEPVPLTKAQLKFKADSLTKIRTRESDEQGRIDLDHRIKIELKAKVDSILNSHLPGAHKDTVVKATVPLRPNMPIPSMPARPKP